LTIWVRDVQFSRTTSTTSSTWCSSTPTMTVVFDWRRKPPELCSRVVRYSRLRSASTSGPASSLWTMATTSFSAPSLLDGLGWRGVYGAAERMNRAAYHAAVHPHHEGAVPTDPHVLRAALLETARLASGGGDLDARLEGLAGTALVIADATACRIHLLDGATGELLPAASVGVEPGPAIVAGDEDPAARVARTRRVETAAPADAAAWPGVAAVACVPLVTSDVRGTQQVEGVMSTGLVRKVDAETLELLAAVAAFAAAAIRSARLERAVEERADWFERVAHTDPLTGLANRRTFERMLELELARAARQGSPLSIALFDVDGLADVSARHGADVGDDVLRRVASTLADSVRLVDTVARIGGDEFAVLAPGAAGPILADRVVNGVAALDPIHGSERIGLSVGVAAFPSDGANSAELISAAEQALVVSKRNGSAG
jgi:diguanylate cyclase (GGDEF)-like protein